MNNETLFEFVTHRQKIINILRCNSTIEKTVLTKKMDISFPTLINQLKELKKRNILLDDSKTDLNPSAFYLCGISIGGAQCKMTLIDAKYNVLSQKAFNEICEKYSVFQQSSPTTSASKEYMAMAPPRFLVWIYSPGVSIITS